MGEAHPSGDVAGPRTQVLAVAGHQGHAHARNRPRGLDRADHGVQPVRAGIGHDRHVGEHDPAAGLGRLLAFVVAGLFGPGARGVAGLDHVAAGAKRLQHRAEGKHGGGLAGRIAVDGERPLPDHVALVVGLGIIVGGIVALSGRVGLDDLAAHQVAVGHAPDLDGQARDVDGVDAHAVGVLARQDHPVAREAYVGRLVREGEVDVGVGRQGLAAGRRQSLQQRDAVVGQPQAADTELIAPGRHGGRALDLGRDQHEVGVVLGRVQRAGHADAVDRLGAGGVHVGGPDRKSLRLRVAGPGSGGRARVPKERPDEAGVLARHIGRLAGMLSALAEQEAGAQAKHQGGRHGSRQDLPVTVHEERFPGRRRALEGWKLRRRRYSIGRRAGIRI